MVSNQGNKSKIAKEKEIKIQYTIMYVKLKFILFIFILI